jgi:hypothetical protein
MARSNYDLNNGSFSSLPPQNRLGACHDSYAIGDVAGPTIGGHCDLRNCVTGSD